MMTALPTGVEIHNGKIRIWFLFRGKRCRETLKGWTVNNANIKKAGNLRAAITGEIQMGTFEYASRFPESKSKTFGGEVQPVETFDDLCNLFLENKRLEIAESSYFNLKSMLRVLTRIIGKNTLIKDIQHHDILACRRELLYGAVIHDDSPWLNKTGRAVSTVNFRINALCLMLKFAHQSKFVSHAAYENIRPLKKEKTVPDPLLQDEYELFINSITEYHARIWRVAIFTGLRHGEICALAWEDVDLQNGKIYVSRNVTQKGTFCPPKTKAGVRTITLLKPALEALREQFELTGHLDATNIVFHHREIGKSEQQALRFVFRPKPQSKSKAGFYSRGSISYSWKRGMMLANLRSRDPYQSRHTYACWSLSAGANPSFIASQMGHENAKMVYTVYSKWIGDMDEDQVGLLDSKFAKMSL
ncbi:site-specific integrase [Klebsiella pneumoniae]|uniref:site-specific integrase n=1 Tax=Klebsiella pneumoniae TaxID=573 RepID=UPI0023806E88|nr:site-specific integrase [Klebsiella pneumoniae]MDE4703571.1 site-specific integrase [Klebsiella pneumoniae]